LTNFNRAAPLFRLHVTRFFVTDVRLSARAAVNQLFPLFENEPLSLAENGSVVYLPTAIALCSD